MLRRLALAALLALAPSLASAQFATIGPTPATSDNGDRLATTAWVNAFAAGSIPLASGKIFIGSAGNLAVAQTMSADATLSILGALTLATVNANVGSFGSATQCVSLTTNAKGLITAASAATCTPAASSLTGTLQAAQEPAHTGDVTNTAGSLALAYANVVPANKGGAGTITGALKGNGSGTVTQAACADLSNAAASCSTDATNATNITSGTLPTARLSLAPITNSLGADVLLNNTGLFFDGPSIAQGVTGTWWVSGTATVIDTLGVATVFCKLWDGTTTISSALGTIAAANGRNNIALSGFIASPAGNLRISCQDGTSTSGKILFNASGASKDSTISAFRIQ